MKEKFFNNPGYIRRKAVFEGDNKLKSGEFLAKCEETGEEVFISLPIYEINILDHIREIDNCLDIDVWFQEYEIESENFIHIKVSSPGDMCFTIAEMHCRLNGDSIDSLILDYE